MKPPSDVCIFCFKHRARWEQNGKQVTTCTYGLRHELEKPNPQQQPKT